MFTCMLWHIPHLILLCEIGMVVIIIHFVGKSSEVWWGHSVFSHGTSFGWKSLQLLNIRFWKLIWSNCLSFLLSSSYCTTFCFWNTFFFQLSVLDRHYEVISWCFAFSSLLGLCKIIYVRLGKINCIIQILWLFKTTDK